MLKAKTAFAIAITALLTVGGAHAAGWTEELWEPYALSRRTITNTYTSNVPATLVLQKFTLQSNATNLPEITFSSPSHIFQHATIYTFPSNAAPGTFTNQFYVDIFDYRNLGSNWTAAATNVVNFLVDGTTNVATIIQQEQYRRNIYDLKLNPEHQRLWEICQAINERRILIDAEPIIPAEPFDPNQYKTIVYNHLLGGYGGKTFIDPVALTSTSINAYMSNAYINLASASNLLAACNLPTNYFDYTPEKHPWGNSPHGREVETCTTIMAIPEPNDSGVYTNTLHLYNSTTTNVSGTNGQRVCVTAVNTNILPGYTENDYSLTHLTNILAQLHVVSRNASFLCERRGGLTSRFRDQYNNYEYYRYSNAWSCSVSSNAPFGPHPDYDAVSATNHGSIVFVADAWGEKSRGSGGRDIGSVGVGANYGSSDGARFEYRFYGSEIVGGTAPVAMRPSAHLKVSNCTAYIAIAFADGPYIEHKTNQWLQPKGDPACIHPYWGCGEYYYQNRIGGVGYGVTDCGTEIEQIQKIVVNKAFPEYATNLFVVGSFPMTINNETNTLSFEEHIAFTNIFNSMNDAMATTLAHAYADSWSVPVSNWYGETGKAWKDVHVQFYEPVERVNNHTVKTILYLDFKTEGGLNFY
jgi:hypothetical protein